MNWKLFYYYGILLPHDGKSKIYYKEGGNIYMINKIVVKVSLLSISLVLTSTAAIASTIPLMKEYFFNYSLASIELLTTVPSLMIMIFILLSHLISRKIGSKNTVVLGLIIALISGVIPIFIKDYIIILISRMALGIGFGLFNSLAISLINDLFSGNEKVQMIGFQGAVQGFGSAILTFLAGQFLKTDWNMAFAIYFIIIPIIILFILFVPNVPNNKKENQKISLDYSIIKYVVLIFVVLMIYNAVFLKTPTLVEEQNFGNAVDTSMILTIVQIGSMITGWLFGFIYKRLQESTLLLALILMAVSFLIVSFAKSLFIVSISSALSGISFSLFAPYLVNKVSEESSLESQNFSISLLIVAAQMAGLLSPYFLSLLGNIEIISNSTAQVFLSGGLILIFVTVGIMIYKKYHCTV